MIKAVKAPPMGNAETWLATLAEPELPLLPGSREAVIHQLHHPGANADSVAGALRRDPVLCLRLATHCNHLLAGRDTEVNQLSHMVTLLGFPALEQLLRRAPVLDTPNPGYLAAVGCSQFAADLAAALTGDGSDGTYLAALFFNAPRWALWHRAADILQRLDQLTAAGGRGRHHAEHSAFGTGLGELETRLAETWQLPAATRRARQFNRPHRARLLARLNRLSTVGLANWLDGAESDRRLLATPELTLALANNLAHASHWDWHSRQTRRWLRLLERQRPNPTQSIAGRVHRVAGQLSPAPAIPAHCHPGRRLLGRWREAEWIRSQAESATVAVKAVADSGHSTGGNPQLLAANLQRLREAGHRFASLHQLMQLAIETLREAAGFERALVMMLNGRRDLLRSHYQGGFDKDNPLIGLRLRIPADTRGIFAKLLEKSGGLRVTPENLARVKPQLPPGFAAGCSAQGFALMSIFYRNLPLAIAYVDSPARDPSHYRLFKQICLAVAAAVDGFARKGQN